MQEADFQFKGCTFTNPSATVPLSDDPDLNLPSNTDPKNPPWPAGIFDMTIEGQGCQYKCAGTNIGRLFCPDKQVSCSEDSAKSRKEGMLKCESDHFFHATIFCDFYVCCRYIAQRRLAQAHVPVSAKFSPDNIGAR